MTSNDDGMLLLERLVTVEVRLFDAADAALRASDAELRLVALLPLRVIAATPSCRVQDVADAIGITVGGASKAIDRLERVGWAARSPHPSDRRSSIVEPTEAGRGALKRGEAIVARMMRDRVGAVLDEREAASLSKLLGRVRAGA